MSTQNAYILGRLLVMWLPCPDDVKWLNVETAAGSVLNKWPRKAYMEWSSGFWSWVKSPWRVALNTLHCPSGLHSRKKMFWISWTTISFSRRILLYAAVNEEV
jgi:hypothetical protein